MMFESRVMRICGLRERKYQETGENSIMRNLLNSYFYQTLGANPASYPMGTKGPFPGGKAAGA
jgi:hypothetical protein